jgi:hypothetical protein
MSSEQAPTLQEIENESAADTMRAVMSEMEGAGDAPKETAEPSDSDTGGDDRERDEKGRFKAKEDDATDARTAEERPEGDATPEPETAAGEAPEGAEQANAEEEDDEPPHDWSAENQELYRALPKEAKGFVKHSVEYAKRVYAQAEQVAQHYSGLEQILAPRRDAWHRNGTDEVGALRQLLALSDLATQRPQDFAQFYVRERGLKPEDIFPQLAQQGKPDDEYADPEVSQLKKLLTDTRQELEQFKNGYTTQQQQQQQAAEHAQYQQVWQYVQQFRNETDERGRAKYPYFEEVQGLAGTLISSGKAPDLPTAYDMACHATPGVRAKIVAAQNAQEQRERARKEREKADAARRAGTSISGTPGDRVRAEPSGDLREDLRSEFASRGML